MSHRSLIIAALVLSTAKIIHAAEPTTPTPTIPILGAVSKEAMQTILTKDPEQLTKSDEQNRNVLHWAIISQKESIVEFLLSKYGASIPINQSDIRGQTPLHFAALRCSNCLHPLLKHPQIYATPLDHSNQTPLHIAVQSGNIASVSKLLGWFDTHAINLQDTDGNTALHLATEKPHLIALLLLHKADRHIKNKNGIAPADNANVKMVLESFH